MNETDRIEKLYYSAQRPREACADAKSWLLDCYEDEDSQERIMLLAGVSVVAAVDKRYDGGWTQFLRDGFNLKNV